ncbi:methylated-DNA--[protein]-cysteine S-methyltransferase [Adlercreutzia sp. R25]|uniref:methylated-DNA--[protein]-cysteine S-methyltransferase n=1 Tax=Adlercreutzia shanghongiae TaxID=3111773 RepID=UPI002DBECCDA|nr:methylated-DNA--[protein]-cysteine S-methyltransferase [Adlercreutzia sp. R25]MEC4272214.1 methylated-DNA--[protein]-cysteine S-methyltransferase [Adlercreutzia sp. R25]
MYYYSEYESPVGVLTVASDGAAVCGLWLEGQKYHGATVPEALVRDDSAAGFSELRAWLDGYFAGNRPAIEDVPLAPRGSDFQQAVWRKLIDIPYGELATYGSIAQALKEERGKASALAVGGAVGHNPLSIIIPCHRVVGADGSLTGYAGGLARKMWLFEHEGVDAGGLYLPRRGTAL